MRNLTIEWAAGLFEGEGCISLFFEKTKKTKLLKVAVKLNSTDEDVIKEFCKIVGGYVTGPYSYSSRPHVKPFWSWQISKLSEMYDFLCRIRPYMGDRRRTKIDEALTELQTRKSIKEFQE